MIAEYRPAFGRVVTAVVAAICVAAALTVMISGRFADLWRLLPWLGLLGGSCWAALWRPRVEVSDGGVRIVNVTRTIDVPWPAITAIDTRWALTLHTAYGKFSAWAAPGAGRAPARRAARVDIGVLGRSLGTRVAAVEPAPEPSREAGELVRARWEQLRAAGHLVNPVLEHEKAPVRWHIWTAVAGVALAALGVVALIV